MSASFNSVVLLGNVTRDPEIRHTPQGTAIAEFSLAINRTFTSGGQKKEEVAFIDIMLWSKLAEVAQAYLKKGNPVLIAGRLRQDSWDDKTTGQKRSKVSVVGETMQLLGGRPAQAEPSEPTPSAALQEQRARNAGATGSKPSPPASPVDPEGDSPF
jgi:single-strand DNA-binding protein